MMVMDYDVGGEINIPESIVTQINTQMERRNSSSLIIIKKKE